MNCVPDTPARWSAFFDVDGTLISIKSMFSFLDFLEEQLSWRGQEHYQRYRAQLQALIDSQAPREAINRFYYSVYAGLPVAQLLALGRAWYAQVRRSAELFLPASLAEIRWHQAQGADVVLVSGSFNALLAPLAEDLGVTYLIGAPLEERDGVYTGLLSGLPTIGQGKVLGLRAHCQRRGQSPEDCYAYGDDVSDVPMLEAVGHPTMVNPDAARRQLCQVRQWNIIDAA